MTWVIENTGRFKICDPSFQNVRPRFPIFEGDFSRRLPSSQRVQRGSWRRHDGCHDAVSEGVDGERAGSDTIRRATQVGPRGVKSGLGGHDDGASGDDEGVKNALT